MLRRILPLVRLRLLLEDLFRELLLCRQRESSVEVFAFEMSHPLLASCEVIVESHRRWLAAKPELPDENVSQVLDVRHLLQVGLHRYFESFFILLIVWVIAHDFVPLRLGFVL